MSDMLGHANFTAAREKLPPLPDAITDIPHRWLSIYMAATIDGYTYREIAEDQHITPQRVYQIVHQTAARIRRLCPVYKEN